MKSIPFSVRPIGSEDTDAWCRLRKALWPLTAVSEHLREIASAREMPDCYATFMAFSETTTALGFAEASIRRDYVNGCDTSPVLFLEGIYVRSEARRNGIAKALIECVEQWGASQMCVEFASDTDINNVDVQALHNALGFEEAERVVFFRKKISK